MSEVITFLQEDRWPSWAQSRHPLAWMVVILLAAAALRVIGIYHVSPPGLAHDEVANWLIDHLILDGRLAIYFQEAYGHEAGFHYLQAAAVALVGDHALALRLPAAFAGLLLVAIQYTLTKRLFGTTTALFAAGILAILFWPVFYSRLGLRAISLPLVCGFALYAWWQAWPVKDKGASARTTLWFAAAGLLAGLSLYTYMAARALPIFYALFCGYLLLLQHEDFASRWRGVALFWLLFGLSALPLITYLTANPGAEFRIGEVDAPLRALLGGDLAPAAANLLKISGMFGLAGDPLWRQNIAGQPVFGPVMALLFYGGVFLALVRLRDARYAFLLLWLGTSAVPSLLTVDAPSSIRMINALLVVTVFPVLVINIVVRLSPLPARLSTRMAYLLGVILALAYIWRTASAIFQIWPQNAEVQFVWQAALTDIAGYLDGSDNSSPAAIGGWSPTTMDPPTMALSMHRDDLPLRFFGSDSETDPISTVIIPGWGGIMGGESSAEARLFRPAIRDLAPEIEAHLLPWLETGQPQRMDTFVRYPLTKPVAPAEGVTAEESFANELQLVWYRLPSDPAACAAQGCVVLTMWQVLAVVDEPRRFFLHGMAGEGDLVTQHDGLDAPARFWQEGDLLLQAHRLPPFSAAVNELRLGVYNPQDGRRLLLPDGRDYLRLYLSS